MIVAEGVESAAELQTLKDLGATRGQGYLLGRPMPCEDFVRFCGACTLDDLLPETARDRAAASNRS